MQNPMQTLMQKLTLVGALTLISTLLAVPASATLMFGAGVETTFQGLGGTFVDFGTAAIPVGTNLGPGGGQVAGVSFASITTTSGGPTTPKHVEVSSSFGGSIVGSPCDPGCVDDGRVGYEIVFDTPQNHAGLLRLWNTSTETTFYDDLGGVLGVHVNTTGTEFVGWIGDGNAGQQVKRIVIDTIAPSSSRQVGYSDNLYFGAAVPEPSTLALLALGLGAVATGRRSRRD